MAGYCNPLVSMLKSGYKFNKGIETIKRSSWHFGQGYECTECLRYRQYDHAALGRMVRYREGRRDFYSHEGAEAAGRPAEASVGPDACNRMCPV